MTGIPLRLGICVFCQFGLRSQWKEQPVKLLGMLPPAHMQCTSFSHLLLTFCPVDSVK